MKLDQMGEMTVTELVNRFAAIGNAQAEALLHSDIARFNRLFNQMTAVRDELKRRPEDQRRALLTLYQHPNRKFDYRRPR